MRGAIFIVRSYCSKLKLRVNSVSSYCQRPLLFLAAHFKEKVTFRVESEHD